MLAFQDSASFSIENLIHFHDIAIVILTIVTTLVLLNITFIIKYKLTNRYLLQEQTIEIIWTVVPIIILIIIALPSLQTLYNLEDPFTPNLTIKAVGHQWYWSYQYSDFPDLDFDAYMVKDRDRLPRLIDADNSIVLPTHTKIRVITTATDVIHAWTVPSLGVKRDAVPGRLNQIIISINRTGLFFGQCSEICGANHRFIPIKLEAVPITTFINWIKNNYVKWPIKVLVF